VEGNMTCAQCTCTPSDQLAGGHQNHTAVFFFGEYQQSINNLSTINNLNLDSPFSGRSGDSDGTALSPSSNLPIAAFAAGVTVTCHVWLKVLAGSFVVILISSGVVSGILHQM